MLHIFSEQKRVWIINDFLEYKKGISSILLKELRSSFFMNPWKLKKEEARRKMEMKTLNSNSRFFLSFFSPLGKNHFSNYPRCSWSRADNDTVYCTIKNNVQIFFLPFIVFSCISEHVCIHFLIFLSEAKNCMNANALTVEEKLKNLIPILANDTKIIP
jgi:hypothetical protein